MARTVNDRTVQLIQSFEKCRLKAYQGAADAPGVYTIGWGHVLTGHEVPDLFRVGQMMRDVTITQQQADALFLNDIKTTVNGVNMRLEPEIASQLTDDQFGALVSLSYNIGLGGFNSSKVKATINSGSIDKASDYFKSWIRANGEVVNGLVRRRAAERALYQSDYQTLDYFLDNYGSATVTKAQQYLGLVK